MKQKYCNLEYWARCEDYNGRLILQQFVLGDSISQWLRRVNRTCVRKENSSPIRVMRQSSQSSDKLWHVTNIVFLLKESHVHALVAKIHISETNLNPRPRNVQSVKAKTSRQLHPLGSKVRISHNRVFHAQGLTHLYEVFMESRWNREHDTLWHMKCCLEKDERRLDDAMYEQPVYKETPKLLSG